MNSSIGERIRLLRSSLSMTQTEFGDKIGLKQAVIGQMENNTRNITDRTIILICEKYSISEKWLRHGQGEMYIEPSTFSLDEFAAHNDLSSLEVDIIKGYMSLDKQTRNTLIAHFKTLFGGHQMEIADELDIDAEVASYRRELEYEKRVAEQSSVSGDTKEA